jgi:MFS transporter, putative metabolite:H+ symporter
MLATDRAKIAWRVERLPSSRFLLAISTILILTYFFESIDNGAIGYFLPLFSKEFNISNATLGLVGTISNVGVMIGAMLSGILCDLYGRKRVIIIAMFFWGVCGVLLATATTLGVLLTARVLLGLGLGAQVPATITLLSEIVPSKLRAKYIIFNMALLPLGSAAAGLISYFFIPAIGWRGVAVIEALPCIVALLVWKFVPESAIWLESKARFSEADAVIEKMEKGVEKSVGAPLPPVQIPENTGKPAAAGTKSSIAGLFSKKNIRSTIMITIWWPAAMAGVYGLSTWFSQLFVARGFTISKSIGYVSIMYLGGVLGIPIVNYLVEKIGRKWTSAGLGIVTAIAAYMYGIAAVLPVIIVAGIFYNVCSYASGMVNFLYTPELYPTRVRASAMGYAQFTGRIGAIVGPIVIGFIMQGFGVSTVFAFAALMFLLYAVTIIALGKETKGIVFVEE